MKHELFKTQSEANEVQVEYVFIDSTHELKANLNKIIDMGPDIGLDTETNGLDPHFNRVLMLQLSDGRSTFVIDARTSNITLLKDYLESDSVIKVAHNAVFDYSMLKKSADICMQNIYCTMVAEQVVSAGRKFGEKFGLDSVAYKRLGIALDKDPSTSFLTIGNSPFTGIQKLYGARDAFILPEIRNQQLLDIEENGIDKIIEIEMGCLVPFAEMQLRGCVLDKEKWKLILEYAHVFENRVGKKLKEIFEEVDSQPTLFGLSSINLNSQPQLLSMFRKFGLGMESTSSEELEDNIGKHQAVDLLLEYRIYEKIRAAYGDQLLGLINKVTGRLHPKFNQAYAKTGRSSSSNPNAQNIPAPKEFDDKLVELSKKQIPEKAFENPLPVPEKDVSDKKASPEEKYALFYEDGIRKYYVDNKGTTYIYVYDFRDCFISAPGYSIVQCDMPKAEICIMADMSGDKKLIDAINNGEDVYKRAAAESLGIEYSSVTPAERKTYKAVVLGLAYGLSAYGLARNNKMSEEHANEVIERFRGAFPVLNTWLDREGRIALMRCYSLTKMGRKLFLPFDIDPNSDPVGADSLARGNERRGKNFCMQGGNADLTKMSLFEIHKEVKRRNLDAGLQLVIHDEFVGEAREDQAVEFGQIMAEKIEEAFKFVYPSVIVKPDFNIGKYWKK